MSRPAIRNIYNFFIKNKRYFVITQTGLIISFVCSFFIYLFIIQQLSFNRCHSGGKNVFRILINRNARGLFSSTPFSLGPNIKRDLPEVINYSRILNLNNQIKIGDEKKRIKLAGVDPGITDIFSFKFLEGGKLPLFNNPNEIALSSSISRKIFGNRSPMGSVIEFEVEDSLSILTVTAVYEDFPSTSTFRPEAITNVKMSLPWFRKLFQDPNFDLNFSHSFFDTYIRIKSNSDKEVFLSKLNEVSQKYFSPEENIRLDLQNLYDIYLHSSHLKVNRTIEGDTKKIWGLSILAIIILFIGTVNFIVLSIAQSAIRFREIGIKKVVGASAGNLISQIVREYLFVSILALPFSFIIMIISLPFLNQLFNVNVVFSISSDWKALLGFLLICIMVGISSGSYLSFYLSRINPISVLQNKAISLRKRFGFFSILVIIQFAISISLFTSSLIITQQISGLQKMDRGFDSHNLLVIVSNPTKFLNPQLFVDEILQSPLIANASTTLECSPVAGYTGFEKSRVDDPNVKVFVDELTVGHGFIETFRLTLLKGRGFTREELNGGNQKIIITENAVKELGITGDPIGQNFDSNTIIGVINNFNRLSAREKILPVILYPIKRFVIEIPVRLKESQNQQAIEFLQKKWKEIAPGIPFEYYYYEDAEKELYKDDRAFGKIFRTFGIIAFVIAALGLFGLAHFSSSRRAFETGMRKVNGARTIDILQLFYGKFASLVFFAFIISIPATEWITGRWLSHFNFKMATGIWPYILAGMFTLILVLITVTISIWRVTRLNPAEVIKTE